ncbi:MAG: 30S ribosomal protein S1 [Thermoanaerobaculia bacterium]
MQSTEEHDDTTTATVSEEEQAQAADDAPERPSDTEPQVVVDEEKVAAVPEPDQEASEVVRVASSEQSEVPDLREAGAEDDGEMDAETFNKLVELYDESMRNLTEGDIVTGRVIGITSDEVIVDVGYKSEGLIAKEEFTDRDGQLTVDVGDEVDVLLEKTEDVEGHVLLSRSKAERMRRWNEIEKAYKEDRIVHGRVVDRIKGGLTVDIGLRAFLPGSLVDIKPIKHLESMKGEELEFKVISLDRRRNNVVLSRKAVLEKELEKKKAETIKKLEEGALLPGVVKNITDYGVFIDLGGIDGLLHITDISWGRVNHPSEHFAVGDEVEVVILKFDPETERVSLGYKQRTEDPWNLVDKKYPVGSKVQGKVVSIVDYGAFVEIEEGVEGLIHVSEMSWTKKVVNPSKIVSVGDEVEAIVSELDMEQRRISLSLRQTEQNPWEDLAATHPENSIVEGKVRNLTDFGAFVEITEGIDGLIHVSDMSWTKRVKHPSEVLKKGETVKARITNIDVNNQRVSLSIKEFMPNEWEDFTDSHHVGDEVTGRVVNVTDFGLFIDIYNGLEGLAHVSEIDVTAGARLEDHYSPGDWVRARILRIEDAEKKVGLTMRGVSQPGAEEISGLEEKEAEEGAKPAPKRAERPVSPAAVSTGRTEALSGTAMADQLAKFKVQTEAAGGEAEASEPEAEAAAGEGSGDETGAQEAKAEAPETEASAEEESGGDEDEDDETS